MAFKIYCDYCELEIKDNQECIELDRDNIFHVECYDPAMNDE